MTDYNDGQIWGWNSGDCPVHPETVVEVWFRCKDSDIWVAGGLGWEHTCEYDDIIAFKVVKPYVEPKVIWVNEYASRFDLAYPDEQSAREYANANAIRIAVKYMEARDD